MSSSSGDSAEDVLLRRAIVVSRETAAIEASARSSMLSDGQDVIWYVKCGYDLIMFKEFIYFHL